MNKAAEWSDYHQIKLNENISLDAYDVILGFENIVLIFDSDQLEIWCYHLLDNTSYKSKCKIPETMEYNSDSSSTDPFAIKDGDNNNAHILNLGSGKHVQIDQKILSTVDYGICERKRE